jgi:uncharacterized protein with HEPN domain
MPPRKIEARLDDMVEELAGIRALLQGVSFEAYRTTRSLRRATERGLEIVAEASRAIPAELQGLQPEIAGLGNLLLHEFNALIPLSYGTLSSGTWKRWNRRSKCCWGISTISVRNDQLGQAKPAMTPITPRQRVGK